VSRGLGALNLRSILLVLLLVAASVIAAFEYAQNAQLLAENQRLKKELSDSSQRLLTLQAQLNGIQEEVEKLRIDIAKLRKQLRMAGSITVGLTFLWQLGPEWTVPLFRFNVSDLQRIVQTMNDVEWAGSGMYFFIRHAAPEQLMSDTWGPACTMPSNIWPKPDVFKWQPWGAEAWQLFPEKDIPVGIFDNVGTNENGSTIGGCVLKYGKTEQVVVAIALSMSEYPVTVNTTEGPKSGRELQLNVEASAGLLTHELLHVFGFSDEELIAKIMYDPRSALPTEWIPRIQAAAKAFETNPPQPGSG